MERILKRLMPLLLLLCVFLSVVSAQQQDVDRLRVAQKFGENGAEELLSASPSTSGATLSKNQQAHNGDEKGRRLVQNSLSTLQKLESSRRRRATRFDRPSGFLGATAYYAKELFFFLFMNGPSHDQTRGTAKEHLRLSQPLLTAVRLLEDAARDNNSDAIYLLGEMNFYGKYSHPRNYSEAFRRYHDLATLTGNSTAQHMIGFMYATGIGGAVGRDQAKALLYHTFAARGGDARSEMTVAFRHHSGIATPRNCDEAAKFYKRAADKAIRYWRAGPPGGRATSRHGYRLAENEGGVYGEGASASSSGVNANKGGPTSDSHAAFDDVLEYLDLMSRKGDPKATLSLGRLYYDGSRVLKRNLRKARSYFMAVAKQYWTRDGKVTAGDQGIEKLAGKAAGYLGRIYLRGDGVEQSFERALTWFKRGIASGDSLSQNDMGLMYLHGYGVPKDAMKAAAYFKAATDQDFAPAQVNLGALFLDQGDVSVATRYFDLAARHGNIEAYYYLAEISNQGIDRDRSCGVATAYYKIVAEKIEIHSSFETANRAYEEGDLETALVNYMMAAEQGYEAGQANVAYLLDEQKSRFLLGSLGIWPLSQIRAPFLRNPELALLYWGRSAKQLNIDSMVKMGDYYLGGIGTEADPEKAASCYQAASEYQQSAQALWNLGWMHENGIGVEQDFHLAKRFYDLAYETNQEAYLPVTLGLLKLRMRSFWNTITNGRVNSIRSEPEPQKDRSFSEWVSNFFDSDYPYLRDDDDSVDTHAYDPMPGGDDYLDDIEDGIFESLVIVGLAAVLIFLLYYRQQRQVVHARAARDQEADGANAADQPGQGAAPPEGQERGFFPNPGEPEFQQWIAGGIAH
ncbi:hypothetical protein GP486_001663 [Trichoglossum hirsutum]|uniref:Ubiquitin-protein ligase Sel1/Ubx2 n=1 Tax=Trichoglossum hirsutum TaxID=265104 RepID=A0A9P8RSE7_9PEZI|nr:hypothetical protein GP486_001663 [Trichoglossum hirsutum]